MKRRLILITEIIAPYRIPVFNALAREADLELMVIFLAENDPGLRKWLVYKNELHFPYHVLSSWRVRLSRRNLLLNWGLSRVLQSYSPDAIVCGGYSDPADWQAWWWARRRGVPFISWVESNANDQRSGGPMETFLKRRFLEGCARVAVPGAASATYVKSFGVANEAVLIAPNAVDNDLYARGAAQARTRDSSQNATLGLPDRYFLFVGRLIREKGVFDLIEAYGRLTAELRQHIGLVFVGEGDARSQLEIAARKVSPGRVIFRGFVQRDQLAREYALADIFVFPTYSDPWGLVVNEAMACGLPIIISDVAGCTADLVKDGWNGRVVGPGNPAKLAVAMEEIACNGELRRVMGERSRNTIADYTPEHCAAGLAAAARSCWDSHAH